MTTYSNFNKGVAFTNAKRTKATQPEMTGSFNLNDEDRTHWLNVYGRVDKEGKVYLDAQFTEILPQGSDYTDAERFNARLDVTGLTNEKAPAFKGTFELPNGDEMTLVVWKRVNPKDQKPMLSFQVDEPQEGSAQNRDEIVDIFGTAAPAAQPEPAKIFDASFDMDSVPF